MDPQPEGANTVTWSLLAASLLTCMFFAASETSLLRQNLARLEQQADRGDSIAKAAHWLLSRPQEMLTTILVGNNVANVALASLTTVVFVDLYPGNRDTAVGLATVTATAVLLVIGELSPKTMAAVHHRKVYRMVALPVRWISTVLWPVNRITDILLWPLTAIFGEPEEGDTMDAEEMQLMVRQSMAEGRMQGYVPRVVQRTLEARDIDLDEVMVPRNRMVTIPGDATVDRAFEEHVKSGYSRIPVEGNDTDEIVGISYLKDLVPVVQERENLKDTVDEYAREAEFLPGMLNVFEALTELRKGRQHMAMVIDEYGGVAGLVTVEDILEELVGDLIDEHDYQRVSGDVLERPSETSAVVRGGMRVEELEKLSGKRIDQGEVDRVGGLVISLLGREPRPEDTVEIDGVTLEVLETQGRAVERTRVDWGKDKADESDNSEDQ